MPIIAPPQVVPGTEINASDVNNPMNVIADLINGNIDQDNIKDGGVGTAELDSSSVTGDKIATNSISTDKLNFAPLAQLDYANRIAVSGNTYEAPSDGVFMATCSLVKQQVEPGECSVGVSVSRDGINYNILVSGVYWNFDAGYNHFYAPVTLPMKAGDIITITVNGPVILSQDSSYFYPQLAN